MAAKDKETWMCPACNRVWPKSVGQCHHRDEAKPEKAAPVVEPVTDPKPVAKSKKKKAASKEA